LGDRLRCRSGGEDRRRQNCDESRPTRADGLLIRPASGRQAGTGLSVRTDHWKDTRALKLKVGSSDLEEDVRRVEAVRREVGPDIKLMIDANQYWDVDGAIKAGRALAAYDPFWFEEPVHPDDLLGYKAVAEALMPMRIAGGEHCPNQVLFKNFIKLGALHVVQPDAVRLGGLPEYLAVALMAAKAGLPALPHVGDMAQLHQHLIVFTRCALGMPELPLEMIPYIAPNFEQPCQLRDGAYVLPDTPGGSTTFTADAITTYAA
jgi:L-fuconate dehydratase